MNFEQIKYFLAAAESEHFTNAALNAAISQSSLSKHISKLEKELGVKLFARDSRNVALTAAGKEFVVHSQAIMQAYEKMQSAMQTYALDSSAGSIKLGSSARLVRSTLVAPMVSFLEECPGVLVSIIEDTTKNIMNMLMDGRINIALVAHLISSLEQASNLDEYPLHRYQCHTVMEDEYYLVVSNRHPYSKLDLIKWSDLKKQRLILLDNSYSVNTFVRRCCHLSGVEPDIFFESNQTEAILGMVEKNSGHTLMSKQVATGAGFSNIVLVPIENPIKRNTMIIYRKDSVFSGNIRIFISHLLKYYSA